MTGDYFTTRTALVTGGARGIGRAVVRRLLAEGARVATCDVREQDLDALQAAASALQLARAMVGRARRAELSRSNGPHSKYG